ncbi:MAG: flagellar hook-length control protein FliK, partial [Archangium sp.]|nr:flagellar hook-length control protein FliK [Archangium sp.]
MAEKETSPEAPARVPGPELRLLDRRAYVGFPELTLAPGVVVRDFALHIPDVTFPMNVSGGAAKYQKKKLDFGFLELSIDAEVIQRRVQQVAGSLTELDDVKLHFRPGALEVQARLRLAERVPVTFKVAFDGDGERLAIYLFDVRLYAFSATPASRVGALLTEAIQRAQVLPEVERRGANGFTTRLLPAIVEQAAVARGYKMPSLDQARLAEATISSKGLQLRFSAGGLPPPATPDEELLLALEGSRAFADAEELLAQGSLAEAREAYLRLGDATEAHPFAVERLLTLLVADPQAHELALDIAASLARRRERSATAMWAEAVVRERRGEFARASERYLALCNLARKNNETAGAFFAAEAAARSSRDHAPQLAVKALHELLGLKPDHLPSLKALARASDQAKDRAGAIRAYRRLAALSRDPAEAAEAHVHLARLFVITDDDVAGARLHCEAALRLAPDHPEALLQLGELCFRSGEHLRAIKALDRLREVAMVRHEVDRVGRANLVAGQVWEQGLNQPENALLRYREAASMLPGAPEPLVAAARVAESLGKVQEALTGYQQAVELAGPAPSESIRQAAHQAHHALARLLKSKLGEPARAREHLEAALSLVPTDQAALDELLPYFRAAGKVAELADACEKSAAVIDEPARRAALWAEAGELYRARLSQPDKAERLLTLALEADPKNRQALEGMLALAEAKRDGAQLSRCLRALAELSEDVRDKVRYARRLAVAARDLAFDVDLAVHAYREVLRFEPDDLPVLGELTALERRRADMPGLAWALEQRARAAETHGDKRLASAALRELAQVLETRLGRAGDALVALEKSVRFFPDATGLLELANLSLRLERASNARRALEDALALLPKHTSPEKLAEVRARLGRACELMGDLDMAREHYAAAFPLRRLDDELAQRLEALYVEAHQTQALTDFWAARAQALTQAGRTHDAAELFWKSAQALLASGDRSGAMLRLSAAMDAAPTGPRAAEVVEAMAGIELERGEPAEAARLFARRATLAAEPRVAARFFYKAASLTRDTSREASFLQQALEADGAFVPARLRRAELIETSNPREALADFEVALAADPTDADAVAVTADATGLTRRAARAAMKSGQYEVARRMYAKFTALHPDDVDAQLELVGLHRRAGALEPLIDLLGELWPRLTGDARAQARREFAEGALTLGRLEAAMDALRSILAEQPADEWAASKLLGLLPNDMAFADERLELLSRVVASATGEAKAELLARRAELRRQRGDLPAARADLLDAAQVSTHPLPLLRALAELSRQAHDDVGELGTWSKIIERAGREPAVLGDAVERLFTILSARTHAGDGAHALQAAELLVKLPLSPSQHFDAWLGLAHTARGMGAGARAEAALLEASRQGAPAKRVEALLEHAELLEARGAVDEAVTSFEAAVQLAPSNRVAVDGLKRTLRASSDWEGLAEVLATEAAHAPRASAPALYRELASLYLERLSQPGPAEAALRRVIALDETDTVARRQLADVLEARGDANEAIALLEATASHLQPTEAASTLRHGASLARKAGEAELELRLMRLAHELIPAQGPELQRLAEALYLRGAIREALPLQRALAAHASFDDAPDEAEATFMRLADLAEQTGDGALAESTLRRVINERPLNGAAVERLAAMLEPRDLRAALELVAQHAETLSRTPRTVERLLQLARRARVELKDVELASRFYERATQGEAASLAIRLEHIELLRDSGRSAELRRELLDIAQHQLTSGDVDAALRAYAEAAGLAEGAGHIDDALRTLATMAEVCADDDRTHDAAVHLRHSAELLRDSKLDLEGAEAALAQAWTLEPTAELATVAMGLAQRRGDHDAEIDWLEKSFIGLDAPAEKAAGFVRLARLHIGLPAEGSGDVASASLLAPDQAEAALTQALALVPGDAEAEALLLALLERQNRVSDIAEYYEAAAGRTSAPDQRAKLLLQAAALYQTRANRPADAAAALLAARAANPDDLELTGRVADLLHELGRHAEAFDFDAVLLEANPFHPSYERHVAALTEADDAQGLAMVLSPRAERQTGPEAAATWLLAADAFRRAGAVERAQVCEAQAFEAAPADVKAFEAMLARAEGDPRRQAEVLAARAKNVPDESLELWRRRAVLLTGARDDVAAASAWDDVLANASDDLEALQARGTLAAQAGGPKASQPYDRRLVQVATESLPGDARRTAWFRLGQAALESKAWRDAIDAFETVATLQPEGEVGAQALSLVSEAYAHAGDVDGQYRTTVRLARRSTGAEAEALFRRAVSLRERPEDAMEALDVLVAAHPGDADLYEKAQRALRHAGRVGDVMQLHERYAAAVGGPRGAKALLA